MTIMVMAEYIKKVEVVRDVMWVRIAFIPKKFVGVDALVVALSDRQIRKLIKQLQKVVDNG